jgi:hypothetical protein
MTRKIGGCLVIIEPETHQTCTRCKRKRECRDLLGNGAQICFLCATREERRAYGARLYGPSN